jgi:hypothetical protein
MKIKYFHCDFDEAVKFCPRKTDPKVTVDFTLRFDHTIPVCGVADVSDL